MLIISENILLILGQLTVTLLNISGNRLSTLGHLRENILIISENILSILEKHTGTIHFFLKT